MFFKPASDLGVLHFGSAITCTGFNFADSYVYFDGMRFNGGDRTWSQIGFQCSSGSNMTITTLDNLLVEYTVNRTSGASSQKITFPNIQSPPNSVSGADFWSYVNDVLTVHVTHSSPVNVSIVLPTEMDELANRVDANILTSVSFMVLAPLVLGAVMLYLSYESGSIDAIPLIKLLLALGIGTILILTMMRSF